MPSHVLYPKVSLERASGKIARWMVAEGDKVRRGQILFEIEDDKAAVEVEAPADGVIGQMTAADHEVDVGDSVALIFAQGETPAAKRPQQDATPARPEPKPAAVAAAGRPRRDPNPTPLARRLASEHGIDLTGIPGTGPRGRVQRVDVLARLGQAKARPAISTSLASLHAQWLRQGQGKPIVLLHGFSADINNWRGMLAGGPVDAPVLAVDLPGHGRSPREVPADFDALAAQVEAAIAAEVAGPAVLAGHSFGSAVAVRIAARGALDVRALALFAPAGLGPEMNTAFVEGMLRAREAASLKPWLLELVADPAVISEAFLRAAAESRRDAGLIEAQRAFAARYFPDGTPTFSIRRDLAGLEIPVRVVFGKADRILPFALARDLPGNVALHAIEQCGHMPHLERPRLAMRILAELIRSA
ncbi:acetoin dehydrogenase dihydrolipoyllysine-residue acetyltransferase subunit [Dongia sp. agr-C8]